MDKNRKIAYFLVVLLSIFILTACSSSDGDGDFLQESQGKEKKYGNSLQENQSKEKIYGNSSINIINGGEIAYQDGWYYYNNGKGLYKAKEDGSEREQVILENGKNINVIGEWIYFSTKDGIRKIKTDGSEYTFVDPEGKNLNVIDDWIYYTDDDGLYKMKTDSTKKELLINGNIEQLIVQNNWIYFCSFDGDQSGIYKIKTDGTEKTLLYTSEINYDGVTFQHHPIVLVDNWIYFHKYYELGDNQTGIYKIKTDGSGLECVVKFNNDTDSIEDFVLLENKLFWSGIVWDGTGWEAEDIGGTFKSDLDGTNTVKISDEEVLYDYSLNGYFIKKIEDNENVIFKLYDNCKCQYKNAQKVEYKNVHFSKIYSST